MYLKQAMIENSGPLRRLELDFHFTPEGAPKPLVLVGTNGGGKTNFLSLVTDALFEAAASHFTNVLPAQGMGRSWFRVVGGRTTTLNTPGGFSLLRFEHGDKTVIYREKSGKVDPAEAAERVPEQFAGSLDWPADGSFKKFEVDDDLSKTIFEDGVYAYFPSSRSEVPYWLNRETIPEEEFEIFSPLAKRLRKPIYVERSLEQLKQWLISVILEARVHFSVTLGPGNQPQVQPAGNVAEAMLSTSVLLQSNLILQKVLDDPEVRFAWRGRKSPEKLVVAKGEGIFLPNLDVLSGGQSVLLGLFGTLLRYGDQSQKGQALNLATIEGICIVDEIDAHIHVDLQHRILPALIKMFPRVQFILSSHSPLFALGMEKEFGADGFQLVEMPAGNIVSAETYSEFGKAMDALTATEAFNEKVLSATSAAGPPIVYVEGETDPPYLQRAAEVLERTDILTRCEIQWIGAQDDKGQAFHTGKSALDHTLSVLRANPKLANRPVLLLYDNDAHKPDGVHDTIFVRSMPTNEANTKVRAGVENLLAESAITDDDYELKETTKPNGEVHTVKKLRKTDMCQRICEQGSEADFAAFGGVLDVIDAFLDAVAPASPEPTEDVTAEA